MKPDTPTRDPQRAPIFDGTAVTTHKTIEVLEFRSLQKGESLKGFVTLELPSSLCLHDCQYHQRTDGVRWIGLPSRPYTKPDGSSSWVRLVDFSDRAAYTKFQTEALAAVDRYLERGLPGEESPQREQPHQQRLAPEVRKPRVQASPEITDEDISF